MADIVGGETIGELMNAFSKFDTDHDGVIGTPELKNVLRFLGHNPTDAELQELAYAMDTNESGTIDLPEFLQAMAKSKADEDAEEDIREAFKVRLKEQSRGIILPLIYTNPMCCNKGQICYVQMISRYSTKMETGI